MARAKTTPSVPTMAAVTIGNRHDNNSGSSRNAQNRNDDDGQGDDENGEGERSVYEPVENPFTRDNRHARPAKPAHRPRRRDGDDSDRTQATAPRAKRMRTTLIPQRCRLLFRPRMRKSPSRVPGPASPNRQRTMSPAVKNRPRRRMPSPAMLRKPRRRRARKAAPTTTIGQHARSNKLRPADRPPDLTATTRQLCLRRGPGPLHSVGNARSSLPPPRWTLLKPRPPPSSTACWRYACAARCGARWRWAPPPPQDSSRSPGGR